MTTTDAQCIRWHETLDVQLLVIVGPHACHFVCCAAPQGGCRALGRPGDATLLPPRLVRFERTHQPDHAIHFFQAKVAGALWHVGTKGYVFALNRSLQFRAHWFGPHGHHAGVFAVQHHQARRTKNVGLGLGVGSHAAVPIQMVLRQVQHHGRGGLESTRQLELKAGQLQHPDFGQIFCSQGMGQRVQKRRADIAGHRHAFAGPTHQMTRERGYGGLAIGTGNGQHLGLVMRVNAGYGALCQVLEG